MGGRWLSAQPAKSKGSLVIRELRVPFRWAIPSRVLRIRTRCAGRDAHGREQKTPSERFSPAICAAGGADMAEYLADL